MCDYLHCQLMATDLVSSPLWCSVFQASGGAGPAAGSRTETALSLGLLADRSYWSLRGIK